MSSLLRKRQANNFTRVLNRNPQLLTCNSYINFLRFYKTQHPRYGLRKLLQNGLKVWTNLSVQARKEFKQKKSQSFEDIRPRLKWKSKTSRMSKVPRKRMPRTYKKRHLTAAVNIKRHKRNKQRWQRYGRKKFPGQFN
ncbi:uncharacterized protein LOC124421248 [Lucilia cuprina]|uniref:uncharacterized protein LOC111682116 n=1 Tax=Lucilia cuprina TaxID=7375 RepID=UPI001F05B2A6|nr:uncharacterized protein LOC111682116 [Lucilia cuprina]XP_046812079.1 uncharacterized protein LOC124421248 [Lucilia cuprina]